MPDEEGVPLDESSEVIAATVDDVMVNTAFLVNRIRAGIRENLEIAEELNDLADQFKSIAYSQQDMVHRLAELGTQALRSEVLDDGNDEEEDEDDE